MNALPWDSADLDRQLIPVAERAARVEPSEAALRIAEHTGNDDYLVDLHP